MFDFFVKGEPMKKTSIKKYIAMILTLLVIFYSALSLFSMNFNVSKAAYVGYSDDIAGINDAAYPGYKDRINNLKSIYPGWNFILYYTGLDWNEVTLRQCQGHGSSPKSLFQYYKNDADPTKSYRGQWYCPVCGLKTYDNGSWYCASEVAIAYQMDPRNFLTGTNISDVFQFQQVSYNDAISKDAYKAMVQGMAGSSFLNNSVVIDAIVNTGEAKRLSPLFITARIMQEQGSGANGTTLTRGLGYNNEYVGYYNYFNIGASGNSTSEILTNGLKTAYNRGWDTPEASIMGGIETVISGYTSKGQDTCYFQKYNVINTSNLYGNQYMQNMLAGQNEGAKMYTQYNNHGYLAVNHTFIIPVYENMPANVARPDASTGHIEKEFDRATLNASELAIRSRPATGTVLKYIYSGADIIILARATEPISGVYWDKVIAGGSLGYAARTSPDGSKTYLATYIYGKDTINGSLYSLQNNFREDTLTGKLIMEPKTTLNDIRNKGYAITSAINKDGVDVTWSETLGTGTVITFADSRIFTVIKIGDVNGDAKVDIIDMALIQRDLMDINKLQDIYIDAAKLTNNKGAIDIIDMGLMQRYLMGTGAITI